MQVLVNPCQGLRPGADVLQGDYPMLFSVGVGRNAPPWYQPSGSGKGFFMAPPAPRAHRPRRPLSFSIGSSTFRATLFSMCSRVRSGCLAMNFWGPSPKTRCQTPSGPRPSAKFHFLAASLPCPWPQNTLGARSSRVLRDLESVSAWSYALSCMARGFARAPRFRARESALRTGIASGAVLYWLHLDSGAR